MEKETFIFNIQHYSLHDGPGIRTIVFVKGCPMRCEWCCNPESQKYHPEISYVESKCIGCKECGFCKAVCPNQAITFLAEEKAAVNWELCTECLKCANICPAKALKVEGKKYSVSEVLDIVEKDAVFYGHGNGGLTVSGGEPLTHKEFLVKLLRQAKKRRIHTAIETCGNADYSVLYEAAKYLDMLLYDIKSMDDEKHVRYTGCSNKRILENFSRICDDFPNLPKKVRTPVIPGFNDRVEDIRNILNFIKNKPNVFYEPLPYHSFGKGKYKTLGKEYKLGDIRLASGIMEEIQKVICQYDR